MIFLKKFVPLFIVILFVFLPFSTVSAESLGVAPLNPEFVQYQRDLENGLIEVQTTSDGYLLGEVPLPFEEYTDLDSGDIGIDSAPGPVYPAAYTLPSSKLSDVRNQDACGACWTFAANASMESRLRPTESHNFSEQDMNKYHGFYFLECLGGNDAMATAYTVRWDGPLNETDMPYPYPETSSPETYSIDKSSGYTTRKHVQDVLRIPARANYTDNNKIKAFILAYGAVYVSFFWDNAFISADDESYYNNSNTNTNHAVTVVGWNDNYAATKFKTGTQPPGNGAFLIRNSWGTSRHGDGYFWLSYYDKSFKPRVAYTNIESKYNYKSIYQYDELGCVNYFGWKNVKTAWGANIFTAKKPNEKVVAVGFYTQMPNVQYKIYLYTNVTKGQPRSGILSITKTGTQTYAGYHTVALNTPCMIPEGQNFSIVVKMTLPSGGYPLPVEYLVSGYSDAAMSHKGESFYSADGNSWADFYTAKPTLKANNCIKAYTESTYTYYVPLFKHQPSNWGGLGLKNLSNTSSATVTVGVYSQAGNYLGTEPIRTIPAKGQDAFTVGLNHTKNGWIKIMSTEKLVGVSFFGQDDTTVSTKMYMADVPFTDTLSKLMVVPHVADNTHWDTILCIANPNLGTTAVTLTYTNKAGVSSPPYVKMIPAYGSSEIAVDVIAGSTNVKGGYVTISALKGLAAFSLYHNLKTNSYSFAGINAVDISSE